MTTLITLARTDSLAWERAAVADLHAAWQSAGLASVPSRFQGPMLEAHDPSSDTAHVRTMMAEIMAQHMPACDMIVQPLHTRRKKVLVADMESTIIAQEILDELAADIGIGERVADITRRAMNGELDFETAIRERVGLLKGQPLSVLETVARRITITPGARELVKGIKESGGTCWLVTGGFHTFADRVAAELGFDSVRANTLEIMDGVLTGNVVAPILDKNAKVAALNEACAAAGVSLAEAIAVGDGANDLPMLQACTEAGGLGVAFHAKPRVRAGTVHHIDHGGLDILWAAQG